MSPLRVNLSQSSFYYGKDNNNTFYLIKQSFTLPQGHGWTALTEKQLDRQITKEELELHCRRRTRGEEQTIQLLDQLIGELISDRGKDSLGVPLLDPIRMQHI
ncbi:hypothetical protein AMECASPLE_028352 [Ameca splendens]|uniref:Uncharacterized protein n=1 Tax=Ameca splendens TaxID=208324 RepID=A0ABV0XIH4_9TELE